MRQRPPVSSGDRAIAPVLAVAIMVVATAGFSVVAYVGMKGLATQNDAGPYAAPKTTFDGDYEVQHLEGEAIPLDDSFLLVTIDGATSRVAMSRFAGATSDGRFWRSGETLCVVGDDPSCFRSSGDRVAVTLVSREALVFTTPELERRTAGAGAPPPPPAPQADLVVLDVVWSPLTPSAGASVTFTVTVKNQGTAAAGPFDVAFLLDGATSLGTKPVADLA
ncbi:MAG: CARDB domain-containing protein, partial [Methanobacteriota archaeon]